MSHVLFVGLGNMGKPMVHQLATANHDVSVTDIDIEAAREVAYAAGGSVYEDGDATQFDAVILMLPNSDIVSNVLHGNGAEQTGLQARLRRGAVIVDMGSSRPTSTQDNAARAARAGIDYVDAPVSGGPTKATTGSLTIMVGADSDDVYASIEPLLQDLGTTIVRTGPCGSAHALKALNNTLSVIGLVGALEMLTVGKKFGLDPKVMLDALNHSTGRNHATEVKIGPQVLDAGWHVGFSLPLTVKDIRTAKTLADSLGLTTPVSDAAIATAVAALDFLPDEQPDQSQVAQYLAHITGVTLAKTN